VTTKNKRRTLVSLSPEHEAYIERVRDGRPVTAIIRRCITAAMKHYPDGPPPDKQTPA
jgi:hypothetical protein